MQTQPAIENSFQRYLLAKQTVDDRALNKDVLQMLRKTLPAGPVRIIEVGAGIGTMLKRLVNWNIFCVGEYVLVDELDENIAYAQKWIPVWAAESGLSVESIGTDRLRLCGQDRDMSIQLRCDDVFDFIGGNHQPADLLVAHAFLDLLPLPQSLGPLLGLTEALAWLTINFDGLSSLRPEIDPVLDESIERLYHASMDRRPTGGDSRTGRKMFEHLRSLNASILAAGASDWVVHARQSKYPADEEFFLRFILGFFEYSLRGCEELDSAAFEDWLSKRRVQIECGELVYIAHQMDFLVRKDV